jgi:hypothetical protein
MRGNQLPVSAARWEHWSGIWSAAFILMKNHKIANNSTTAEAGKKEVQTFKLF